MGLLSEDLTGPTHEIAVEMPVARAYAACAKSVERFCAAGWLVIGEDLGANKVSVGWPTAVAGEFRTVMTVTVEPLDTGSETTSSIRLLLSKPLNLEGGLPTEAMVEHFFAVLADTIPRTPADANGAAILNGLIARQTRASAIPTPVPQTAREIMQADGSLKCAKCGGTQFSAQRSTGMKIAWGAASLLASPNELHCIVCGTTYKRG